jgi:Domain of unknown function (DUF4157)
MTRAPATRCATPLAPPSHTWQRRATAVPVNEPGDVWEQEADQVADSVVATGALPAGFSISHTAPQSIQRDGPARRTEEEKYEEAAKKAGEAFMATPVGKKIKQAIEDDPLVAGARSAGEAFISTLSGKVITGAAAVGTIGALAATHQKLPVPIPEIPLDKWAPGLKLKVTYEGPVDRPTKAMLTFSYTEGAGARAKPAKSENERLREETARMAADQAKFRAGLRYTPGSPADLEQKAEDAAMRQVVAAKSAPLFGVKQPGGVAGAGAPDPSLQLSPPKLGFKPKALRLLDEELKLRPIPAGSLGETPLKKDEEPGRLMRKHAGRGTAPGMARPMLGSVLDSPGQPLDHATRGFMESRFGHDFGHVRIHTDGAAARSAEMVDAIAYTVGRHVVFAAGRYAPSSPAGQRLLAHELTHVVQQGAHQASPPGPVPRGMLQRKGGSLGGFFVNLGRSIASVFVDEPGFSDTTLQRYLATLDGTGDIEDDYDSDDKARIVVKRWMLGASGFSLSKERKVLLIREMVSGFTGDADETAILNLLAGSSDDELTFILGRVTPAVLRGEIHGAERGQLEVILRGWAARTGPQGARDVLAGTHAVTPTEHAFVESKLTPGATLAPAPPVLGGAPPPPPVVVPPPAMTGLPPAPGVAGAFETEMLAAMTKYVQERAKKLRDLKAAGPPAFPISRANAIGVTAQQQTEEYFAPYIRVASRAPSDVYHPGAYSLTSMLGDQSTVPITDAGIAAAPGVTPHPGRLGWTKYWMNQDSSGGRAIMSKYHCVPSVRAVDQTEFDRVQHKFATDPANRADIDDTIHGWPAEATGGVNIQPYQSGTTPRALRANRWDLFTTLIHEMMHVLQHPNFKRTYTLIGGDAMEILKEGFADVMRRDLWDGPGRLAAKLATPAYAPVRQQVEGADYEYDASVVVYHPDYQDKYPKAKDIVTGAGGYPGVGIANARAAFFLGHTQLLGLGAGTATTGGASLAGVASYSGRESADAEIVLTTAGDTESTVRARTGATAGGILDAGGRAVAAGTAFAAGTRVRVPGIRYVYALQEDTLGGIATQNNVTPAALALANRLPPATPPSHTFPAGTRLLVPRRPPP